MDSETAQQLLQATAFQADPEIAGVLRQALMDHLNALGDPQTTLVDLEPVGDPSQRRKRILLLYGDGIVTIQVEGHPNPSLQVETRSLREAVVSFETRVEGSPQKGEKLTHVSAWRFRFPIGEAIEISGRVPDGGVPDHGEEFTRAVAANVGPRLAYTTELSRGWGS